MPMLSMYVTHLNRVSSTEALEGVTVAALGSGSMEKKDQERILSVWQSQAGIEETPRKRGTKVGVTDGGLSILEQMGVAVRVVETKEKPPEE